MTNLSPPPLPPGPTPFKKRLERTVARAAMYLLVGPIRALPLPVARRLGKAIGWVLYRCLGRYRRVALKNLALIYTDKPALERSQMAKAVFRHFGEVAAEFIKLPGLTRERVDDMVTVEGEEHLKHALDLKKGGFIITGHFGNWEFLARWLTTHGYKLNVVARDARDPAATKLMTEVRQGSGAQVLYRGNSARGVLQSLKRNELVALLPDQNAADVFVPFLGVSTGTVDGPAILALKTGAPLLFSWCWRTPDDRFHITFEPPEIVETTGDRVSDIHRVTSLINARLETQIKRRPTQWLWLHDRWKATPGVFPDGDWHAHDLTTRPGKIKQEIEDFHGPARR
jgi:KDO2-lipid IV(A) lauroyltransferase